MIKVAWGPGAHEIYPKSVANTRVVGAVVAHFLTSLKDEYNVSMTRVHLLGHSLGAHIAGYVGSRVKGIARISGQYVRVFHVSRFGLALRREAGKQRDLGLNPLQLSFHFKSCGLRTLSCDVVPHN